MSSRAAGTGAWEVGVRSLRAGEPCPAQAPALSQQGALHTAQGSADAGLCWPIKTIVNTGLPLSCI